MVGEQLEFNFGPDFPRVSCPPKDPDLPELCDQIQSAIRDGDWARMTHLLVRFKTKSVELFWQPLQHGAR